MGCGQTLARRDDDGTIRCYRLGCPRPEAVDTILREPETDHIVQFDDDGFTIRYPLRERLDDALMQCDLHHYCARLDGPPDEGCGRYRATTDHGIWAFQAMDEGAP